MNTILSAQSSLGIPIHQEFLQDSSTMSSEVEPLRKKRIRERLDHLTPEEKQERRKAKNRQAAQTARDRKRQTQEQSEAKIKLLSAELEKCKPKAKKYEQILQVAMQLMDPKARETIAAMLDDSAIKADNQSFSAPQIRVTADSGVSDIDSTSKTSSPNPTGNYHMGHLSISQAKAETTATTATTTTTPNSIFIKYDHLPISPAPSSEDHLIDSFIGQENEEELTKEVEKVMSYIDNGVNYSDVSLGSAVFINTPPQQVQEMSSKLHQQSIVNSLGWTSIQLMLIILISRIHHTLSVKINCCHRGHKRMCASGNGNQITSNVGQGDDTQIQDARQEHTIVDYILNTKCLHYRLAVEAIVLNGSNISRQRKIALDFVNKYMKLG